MLYNKVVKQELANCCAYLTIRIHSPFLGVQRPQRLSRDKERYKEITTTTVSLLAPIYMYTEIDFAAVYHKYLLSLRDYFT